MLGTKDEDEDEDEDGGHVEQGHKAKELVRVLPQGARYRGGGWEEEEEEGDHVHP